MLRNAMTGAKLLGLRLGVMLRSRQNGRMRTTFAWLTAVVSLRFALCNDLLLMPTMASIHQMLQFV
jgi:hypothetical protein